MTSTSTHQAHIARQLVPTSPAERAAKLHEYEKIVEARNRTKGITVNSLVVEMQASVPTELTPDRLSQQLKNIGLSCTGSSADAVAAFIPQVRNTLPATGKLQAWGIEFDQADGTRSLTRGGDVDAHWKPMAAAYEYTTQLRTIISPQEHFFYLVENRPGFNSIVEVPYHKKKNCADEKAIIEFFSGTGGALCASTLKGIDRGEVEAMLNEVIAPGIDWTHYDAPIYVVMYLVDNPQPTGVNGQYNLDGLGAMHMWGTLKVDEHKECGKGASVTYNTTLDLNCYSVLYGDATFVTDYQLVCKQFGLSGTRMIMEGSSIRFVSTPINKSSSRAAAFKARLKSAAARGITVSGVPILLEAATPSVMTASRLSTQLLTVGFDCEEVSRFYLGPVLAAIRGTWPTTGNNFVWSIRSQTVQKPALFSQGHWVSEDEDNEEILKNLRIVTEPQKFSWLMANSLGFNGILQETPLYTKKCSCVDAFQEVFSNMGRMLSSAVLAGIEVHDIDAVMTQAFIGNSLSKRGAVDLEVAIVDNYSSSNVANAIGMVRLTCSVSVEKVSQPLTSKHNWNVSFEAKGWSVVYGALTNLSSDVEKCQAVATNLTTDRAISLSRTVVRDRPPRCLMGKSAAVGTPSTRGIVVNENAVTVFTEFPPANADTFDHGANLGDLTATKAMIFYCPDLQCIATLDNTNSEATTSWSRSVSIGFTFSVAVTMSLTTSVEVDFEVVKGSLSFSMSTTVTNEYSKTTTETIECTAPPGKMVFFYQGRTLSRVLTYDPATSSYSYETEVAKYLSPAIVTSSKALV